MNWYENFLKRFFHDPIDKPFDIPNHEKRAEEYSEFFNVGSCNKEEIGASDRIASCMERSLLPEKIIQDFTEIRHPLSEEKINISIEKDKFPQIIEQIKNIISIVSNNYRELDVDKKAFSIWRNLMEELIEKIEDKELKKILPLVPADTRVPDHSIWEHLKVATAINAYEKYQNNSLFLFSIGPVQSFISQARKTQDFFMGSFILSYLTFVAMEKVIEKYGPTSIIYPDLYKQPLMDWYLENYFKNKEITIKSSTLHNILLPTIPNRFVAIIWETDDQKIKDLVEKIREAIKTLFESAQKEIFSELKIELSVEQMNSFNTQLQDFPHIYWVAIPWRIGDKDLKIDDLKDFFTEEKIKSWNNLWNFPTNKVEHPPNIGFIYQLLYTTLEKSLGARKNLRNFEQYCESGRKCSVCGERNVLFFRESENKNKFKRYNEDALDLTNKIESKYLADGEGLCALCFIKRTFEIYLAKNVDNSFKDFSFPSTAEVACADFKLDALKGAKEEFKEYVQKLKDINKKAFLSSSPLPKVKNVCNEEYINLESSWLYTENLTKKRIKEDLGIDVEEEKLVELRKLLEKIYNKLGRKPNSYYAVIHLDGDSMGKWLSGELLPDIEHAYNSAVWEQLPDEFKQKLTELLININPDKEPKKFLTPAIHSAISTALRNYSIEFVRKIVEEEHLGKLIYAGGDDVLAFVNLRDLFDVMEKLRWAFSGHIRIVNGKTEADLGQTSGFVEKDGVYHLTMGKNATCSMGVVIAHYKEPLQIVIKKVFEMEKEAKKKGKDRFAISLIKKSGEERIGVSPWKYNELLITQILKEIKDNIDKEREDYYFSDGFIQKLKNEFLRLKDKKNRVVCSEALFIVELSRLVNRAFNSESKISKEGKKKIIQDFSQHLESLLTGLGGIDYIDYFTSLLEITSFMNKGD